MAPIELTKGLDMFYSLLLAASVSLNGTWEFARHDVGRAPSSVDDVLPERWASVTVPHDWAISGTFDLKNNTSCGGLPFKADGWYRRSFEVTENESKIISSGGKAYLTFDGVMARPKVFVNGKEAGGWDYGYMGFTLDVTPFVKKGENELAVFVTTRTHYSRWYPGGGIYRDVSFEVKKRDGIVPGSVSIVTEDVSASSARVVVSYELDLSGQRKKEFIVKNPRLWSPESPFLYTVEIEGEKFRYGIRTFKFTADDGLHLNGKRCQIKGVNLHSDLGLLGMAFDKDAAKRQLNIMKSMGVNSIRTSHNAPASALLDLCDEMGFIVWNECFDRWDAFSGRKGEEKLEDYCIRNLHQFVRRDRNHPCVFVWSIGNEIPLANKSYPDGVTRERCRLFREAIRSLDVTRPVGIGSCFPESVTNTAFADLDITGWNYQGKYVTMKKFYPDKPVVYSESASALSTSGFYSNPPSGQRTGWNVAMRAVDSYDHNAAPWSDIADVEFARMEADSYCAGEYVWTGIDYLGEPTPFISWFTPMKEVPLEELARSSYFGIVDLTGRPKDRFYLYQSYWNPSKASAHILPHWNWREGDNVPVFVYGSGDEAELYLNGRSLGVRRKKPVKNYSLDLKYPKDAETQHPSVEQGNWQTNSYYDVCERYRFRWADVPYERGEIKAVVRRGGKDIATATMRTSGKGAALKLTEDPYNPVGAKTVFVQVDLVDENGVPDLLSNDRVYFSCTGGEIVAVGNADPRGRESFSYVKSHKLFFGKAMVVVRLNSSGAAVLEASSPAFKSASIRLGK